MLRFLSSSNVVENTKPRTSTGENVLQGISGDAKTSKDPKMKKIFDEEDLQRHDAEEQESE